MKIRLQADADLNAAILLAATRREPGMDFQTAQAAKLRSLSDVEVLAVAAREGRVLVTHEDDLKKHEAEARAQARLCAARLVERFGVSQVYLIGSLARQGAFHEGSDIDLAVAGLAPERYWAALDEVAGLADREVELIRLEDADPEMAAHVAAEGMPLT